MRIFESLVMQQQTVFCENKVRCGLISCLYLPSSGELSKKKKQNMSSLGNFSTASCNSSKLISHYEMWLPFPQASDLSLKGLEKPLPFLHYKRICITMQNWKTFLPGRPLLTLVVGNSWSHFQCWFFMLTNHLFPFGALSVLLKDPRNFYSDYPGWWSRSCHFSSPWRFSEPLLKPHTQRQGRV